MPRHHFRLITELVAFKQAEGVTLRDLARELGIDETVFIRLRTGVRSPSKAVLVKIIAHYGMLKLVRDLVWYHLAVECRHGYVSPEADPFEGIALPPGVAESLRSYVAHFAEENVRAGRGLYLVATDPAPLAAAFRALTRAFDNERVRHQPLRGDARLDARAMRSALAAPLVLIERTDFASDGVAEILRRRADLTRPCIVTSLVPPAAIPDAYLRRIALSTMRLIECSVVAPSQPTPAPPARAHVAS